MYDALYDTATLQYRIHALKKKIAAFESGEKYVQMQEEYQELLRYEERRIKKLEKELSDARAQIVTVRKYWSEIFDDLDKEHSKELSKKDTEIAMLKKRILEVERQRDEALDKLKEKRLECYEVQTRLEEAQGLNQKLTAQVNMNFENSSIPSSMQGPKRKKIPNSRVATNRKPGGQPGHKGHKLDYQAPTESHMLPDPEEYTNNSDYYDTGKVVKKQKISIHIDIKVTEYIAKVFRNRKTGGRFHAEFPEGYVNKVNYDGSVKSLAFLLTNECNVSAGKTRRFLSEISDGKINMSEATINGLGEEFSSKTEAEKKENLSKLMTSPVINTDFTCTNVNGETRQVLIMVSPSNHSAMYIPRESKGHKGIQGTPLADYVGALVHDHDKTFYSYGLRHQECMQHNCRYLIGSEENEPNLEWNRKMHALIQEMLHYRNSLSENEALDPVRVAEMESRYDEILKEAEKEYEYEPPSDYYREGYNLYRRLVEYKESELLFLHEKNVPANNSLAERMARVYKRKQKQAIVFRSDYNVEYLCDCLGLIYTLRHEGGNLYKKISDIYGRKRYREKRKPPKCTEADVNV